MSQHSRFLNMNRPQTATNFKRPEQKQDSYTFKPQISFKSSIIKRDRSRSIHERLYEEGKLSKLTAKKKLLKLDLMEKQIRNQPKINKMSAYYSARALNNYNKIEQTRQLPHYNFQIFEDPPEAQCPRTIIETYIK